MRRPTTSIESRHFDRQSSPSVRLGIGPKGSDRGLDHANPDLYAAGKVEPRAVLQEQGLWVDIDSGESRSPHACATRRYGACGGPSWRFPEMGDWR